MWEIILHRKDLRFIIKKDYEEEDKKGKRSLGKCPFCSSKRLEPVVITKNESYGF